MWSKFTNNFFLALKCFSCLVKCNYSKWAKNAINYLCFTELVIDSADALLITSADHFICCYICFFWFKYFLKGFENIFKGIWKYFSLTTFHDLFEARRTTHQLQLTLDWLRKTVIIIMICIVGSEIFQDDLEGFNDRI